MVLWRIGNHRSLGGLGGLRASGRWHTRGRRIVYCAASPAAALLEVLVHFEIDLRDLPRRYRLMRLETPGWLDVEQVVLADLPKNWTDRLPVTQASGDAWLAAGRAPLLRVPSAIVPDTANVLLNPQHRDATHVVVTRVSDHALDPRLL